MFEEYLVEKALDKALELIKLGYRKLDAKQDFLIAYENTLSSYRNKFGQDDLYDYFFREYHYDFIKQLIDNSPSSRELVSNLIKELSSILPKNKNIDEFITMLFTELLFTEQYEVKILETRRDNEINQIYKTILELKNLLYQKTSNNIDIKFSNNMYQNYLNKWNNTLFLHKDSPKIFLKDIYVLSFYKEKNSANFNDIREDLDNKIDLFLGDSIIGNRRKPMLILADAGMGKSSLVSYICSKCPQKTNLIVLKFSDLHKDSLNTKILSCVLRELNCEIGDLRNKRLIIDGFDESEFTTDRNKLLSNFFNDCQNIQGLKVLVTSRVNYIDSAKFTSCKLYYLQFLNNKQIIEMSNKFFRFSGEKPFKINNSSNNDVVGVPLILYMILSLKIHIEEGEGICELYDKIFAFEGGIYDRMTLGDSDGYSEEVHPIAYTEVKNEVHKISQLIAFAMFETNSLLLTKEKYIKIVQSVSEDRTNDFAISNYYYIESSTYALSFCHKSIYEYFVAEHIYNTLSFSTNEEEIAQKLSILLNSNLLNEEILLFFSYKIYKIQKDVYSIMESTINLMIKNGMTYFLNIKKEKILQIERIVFVNILLILDVYYRALNIKNFKNININNELFEQLNNRLDYKINLNNIQLRNLNLSKKNFFSYTDLNNALIYNTKFENTNIQQTSVINTKLERVSFRNVSLNNIKFNNSILDTVHMEEGIFYNCNFRSCIMTNIYGKDGRYIDCVFKDAKLSNIDFVGAKLCEAVFDNSELNEVDFNKADLKYVSFAGANLINVKLQFALNVTSIKLDKNTKFCDSTVDTEFANKLLNFNPLNLINIKVYDDNNKKIYSFEEYIQRHDSAKSS